jgi:hypothetical protein
MKKVKKRAVRSAPVGRPHVSCGHATGRKGVKRRGEGKRNTLS